MKKIRINLDKITDFDLKLAKNPNVVDRLDDIIAIPLQERERKLRELQHKIQQGDASLFEEKVLTKLYDKRTAEWIKVIHRNLPAIEKELEKRKPSHTKQPVPAPASPAPSTQTSTDEYPSELLEFLATQKPPPPPEPSRRYAPSQRIEQDNAEKTSGFNIKDIVIGVMILGLLSGSIWYVRSSENTSPSPTTFNQQAQDESGEAPYTTEQQQAFHAQFEAAVQHLRAGNFDEGETQLLAFAKAHPDTSYAEEAYLLLAETARQRQHDPEKALAYYQEFTEKFPESQQLGLVQLKMGFTYEDLEDTTNAKEMYRLLIQHKGTHSRLGQLANDRLSSLQNQE